MPSGIRTWGTLAAALLVAGGIARAQSTVVDGGLALALPAALPTGLSSGVVAGAGRDHGLFAWGVRASWTRAIEDTASWRVRHADLSLLGTGALQAVAGRGTFALRLGAGATLVHETRRRHQGDRAGLTGDELQTTAWRLLPAAALEGAVALRLAGPWVLVVSGGPSIHLLDGGVHGGWAAGLEIAWRL